MDHFRDLPAPRLRQAGLVPFEPGRVLDRFLKRRCVGVSKVLIRKTVILVGDAPVDIIILIDYGSLYNTFIFHQPVFLPLFKVLSPT